MPAMKGPKGAARRLQRRHSVRLVALAAALAVLAALLVPLGLPNHHGISRAVAGSHRYAVPAGATTRAVAAARAPAPGPPLPQATLTVDRSAGSVPVPSSYFGISTEYWALPLFERNMRVFERVLSLLHVQGDGPLVLRIGGDSADHSFWHPRRLRMPDWAFALTPGYLSELRGLIERDRVKLIVDLNLVTDTPLAAAAWAHAAETSLPHGSIVGFEVGNEPDLYSRRYWVATIAGSPLQRSPLPLELTPATYVQDFAAYARAIGENAPDIPLVGPAVAHPRVSLAFVTSLIDAERPELGAVSGHLYPYSACVKNPRAHDYPTVARLLSRAAVAAFSTDIAWAAAVAHENGLKFRLTEFNSVTCGGKPGVSNTFATALWAPDALFTAIRAGADGANLHVRSAINAPFAITRGGLEPRPLLYGLMLFNRALGPRARLLRVHLSAGRSLNLSAWATAVRGGIMHVVLIDKGDRTVRIDLHLPTTRPGTVQRLLAPSPSSRSGVTLDGQQLNWAGSWSGTRSVQSVTRGPRGYEVVVPGQSAALISLPLGSAAPAHRRAASEHHRRVAVAQHAVLAVGLNRSRKH